MPAALMRRDTRCGAGAGRQATERDGAGDAARRAKMVLFDMFVCAARALRLMLAAFRRRRLPRALIDYADDVFAIA